MLCYADPVPEAVCSNATRGFEPSASQPFSHVMRPPDDPRGLFPDDDPDHLGRQAFDPALEAACDAPLSGGVTAADDFAIQAAAEPDTYWSISRRPLTSLVFALPMVMAYEGGVRLLGRGTARNGADVWLRTLLDNFGFGQYFLLPVLTIVGLLAWHHIEHDRWRFSPGVLAGMTGESVLWATVLFGIAILQNRFWPLALGLDEGIVARLVAFSVAAAAWGVVGSSVLFSFAHYVGPLGDAFDLHSFTFRFLAGVFFAILFQARGFGIAAGSHAAYDILVGLRA